MRFKEIMKREKKLMETYYRRFETCAYTLPRVKFHPKRNGNKYKYYILEAGEKKEKYLSWKKNGDLIKKLLDRQNALEKVKMTEENIAALEVFLKSYHFHAELFSESEREEILLRGKRHFPVSQNPFNREELIHDTGLGFFTRSKWLDDGRIIYLEHAGKCQDEDYMERFKNRLMDYHAADLLVSRDLFITVDGPKGDIDVSAIDQLISSW